MNNSIIRPRRESALKITILERRVAAVSQLRLAHIQQLQSDITELHRQLTKEYAQVRKEILKGIPVQSGPLHVFIRKKNGKKKMVIK